MRIAEYARIADVPAALWAAAAPRDFFFRPEFLRVMEETRVEDARYRYLVLLEGGRPAGAAVLTRFTLRLDLLAGDPWVARLRRWMPGLLDAPIICCGIPASYGQHHLHVGNPDRATRAVRLVHRYMLDWAETERCAMLFWKEWNPQQAPHAAICEQGYTPLPTLPDHRLFPGRGGIAPFLASMRSSYRRKYRQAAALLRGGAGRVWTHEALRLEESPFLPAHADAFYRGYRKVMERTRVRLETYPAGFFSALATSGMDVRLLRLTHCAHGETLAALLYPDREALTFGLIAKERAHYRASLYTMLLQSIALWGIRHGCREVRLGQTSSYAKCSIGARPWRLETLVRMRVGWQQRLLDRLGPRLFPEVEVPRLSVFRDPTVPRSPEPVHDHALCAIPSFR